MSLRIRHLLATLLVVLGAGLAFAGSAFAGVLSFSGAERPLAQDWASYSCQDASRVQQVESPAAQGKHAYQLEVKDGDNSWGERCEIGMGNPSKTGFPLFHEGDERWISFQVYLPDDYPIDTHMWNVFFQIHQTGDGGCPPIALSVQDGEWKMFNTTRNTYVLDTYQVWSAPAQRNHWAKFKLHIMNSTDDNAGFVELFGDLDGQGEKLLLDRTHTHTMTKDSNGVPMTNHARVGIYRNPKIEGTTHILFDGFTIATDQASAETTAFGDSVDVPGPPVSPPPVPTPPVPTTSTGGNPTTGTTPTGTGDTPKPPATTKKRRSHRVVLRTRHRRAHPLARSSGHWPHVLPVYGWVKSNGHVGRRSVVIEIRRHGRWLWLSRGWLRSNGRFYLTVTIDSGMPHKVELRAYVPGVGYSKTITARV
jgi:polysaccharide lyase-like protein